VRTAAATARELAQSLEQATGLTPSQVSERAICPPAGAGRASCAARVLVLRSDGAVVHPRVHPHPSLGRVSPTSRSGVAKPAAAPASSPPQAGTPAFLQQAYDLSYLSQAGGTGDTVAVIDAYDDPTAAQDLATYRSTYGIPACGAGCFEKVNQSGHASPLPAVDSGWQEEESLDLDAVTALCPNCHILLVEAKSDSTSDLETAMATATSMGASQISDSWTSTAASPLPGADSGTPTVAAAGDSGYVGPGEDNYPAAFPWVTAAGGTSLAPSDIPNARGFGESAWSLDADGNGGGSGCDLKEPKPSYQTDVGCTGRSYADVSADADPSTGLSVYDSALGGWTMFGGTSLATPLIASYYAITGVTNDTAGWAYADSALLNDVVTGSNGTCASDILYICKAGPGYDGPTGVGSISGAAVSGAPGIGGPSVDAASGNTYTESVASDGAAIVGGIYPNGRDTSWWIEYGTSTAYGSQTPASDVGSGTSPVAVNGYLLHLTPGATYHYRLVAQNGLGTTYGYDYTFTTPAVSSTNPTAAFTTSPGDPAPGTSATFDASRSTDSGATITDYRWDFGDGTVTDSGTVPSAVHAYTARGVYDVTLVVTNDLGQHDIVTQTVTADDPPTVVLRSSATTTTPGSELSFTGAASADGGGSITDYRWEFGDNTSDDTGTTPADDHSYTSSGVYTVTLTATDDLGVSSSATQLVTVDTPPTAAFTAPDPAIPGEPASFDATNSTDIVGTITGYSWSFGDGGTAGGPNPGHAFATRGQYVVTLTVTNDAGQTATSTQTVTVDNPPTPRITPSATVTTPGTQLSFDGTASTPGAGGTISDYKWNFGDGTTDAPGTTATDDPGTTATDDTGTTASDSHTYTTAGVYTVTLTTTDDLGVSISATSTVTVDAPPMASFTMSSNSPTPGSSVNFDAGGSSDAVGTITTYAWNFGDGSTGTGSDPSHAFAAGGTYAVALTVTNDAGQIATNSQTVTVEAPRAAPPSPAPTPSPGPAPSPGPGPSPAATPTPAPAAPAESARAAASVNPAPPPLTGRLTIPRGQTISSAAKHGLRLSVSLARAGQGGFLLTVPPVRREAGHPARSTPRPAPITLLRIRGRAIPSGTHVVVLDLSPAADRQLSARAGVVVTVQMTVTDAYGTVITRSARVTLQRDPARPTRDRS
jgi:PKD repeat protein